MTISKLWNFRASTLPDPILSISLMALVTLGLVMLASASAAIAEQQFGQPFYYFIRQMVYLGLGVLVGAMVFKMPMEVLQKAAFALLLLSLFLLVIVLIPGMGHSVNGSKRWLNFGFFRLQASEFAKLGILVYLADYLVRRGDIVRRKAEGFIRPMMLLVFFSALLLLEPDFGAVVVMLGTAMGMMFLAGVRFRYFLFWILLALVGLSLLAFLSPYRLERLTAFLNPWSDQFNSGYQLTQALIAFGRGEWFGVGLGNGVQKLFYLPEAHTDFILAVLAEELGLVGVLGIVVLFSVLVTRILVIGFHAVRREYFFQGYLAYGIGLLIGIQFMINVGVNLGILPTKGLTLPLMSYGGSNFIITCVALAWLFRIEREIQSEKLV